MTYSVKVWRIEKLRKKIIIFINKVGDYWCLMNEWKLNDVREGVWEFKGCFGTR